MTHRQNEPKAGRLSDLVRGVLEESPEAARAYLRESWLLAAVRALRDARRKAGLSQSDVAERLGTTQPAIARLENDREGRITLHRYIDYAIACGMLPLEIVLEPAESVRQFAIARPDAPRTQCCYQVWAEGLPTASATSAPLAAGPAFAGARGATECLDPVGALYQAAGMAMSSAQACQLLGCEQIAPQPGSPVGWVSEAHAGGGGWFLEQGVPPAGSPVLAA